MSAPFKINLVDLKKIGKGAVVVGIGSGLIFALQEAQTLDFGEYTPLAVAILTIAVNTVRKYFFKSSE